MSQANQRRIRPIAFGRLFHTQFVFYTPECVRSTVGAYDHEHKDARLVPGRMSSLGWTIDIYSYCSVYQHRLLTSSLLLRTL